MRLVCLEKPTVGSLFSGVGGIDLGFERAGWEIVWQVENNPFCLRVLAKHWPEIERYGDVRDFPPANICRPDIIVGGFPCQPHSVAGKRRGKEDDRDLWPQYRRVVEEIRPRWVLAENVLGIKTTVVNASLLEMGNEAIIRTPDEDYFTRIYTQQEYLYLNSILQDLETLGYEVVPLVIPACAFDAPHRRERVFVVAYAEQLRCDTRLREPSRQQSGIKRQARSKPTAFSEDVADANDEGLQGRFGRGMQECPSEQFVGKSRTPNVADTSRQQCDGSDDNRGSRPRQIPELGDSAEETRPVSSWWTVEPNMGGLADGIPARLAGCRWLPEPPVGRVAIGIPDRTAKLKALGNAVVPQVAKWIGQQIIKADSLA